jgi:hypothetical protein
LTKEQPNLAETFACVAKLGISGTGLMGEALTMAMKPEINAPGGCNAGFLRDDALLMVTFIGGYDYNSKWDPGTWSANVLKAKKGDAGAVVMLSILDPTCPAPDRICQLVKKYPYHLVADGPRLHGALRAGDGSHRSRLRRVHPGLNRSGRQPAM